MSLCLYMTACAKSRDRVLSYKKNVARLGKSVLTVCWEY